jgi:hypothetical protein
VIVLPAGGGVATFDTVTVTMALVVAWPAAFLAIASRVWLPLLAAVVFQENTYGALLSAAPTLAPSTWNCTLATPTLSDAFAVTLTVPDAVAPFAGAVIDTVGGVPGGPLFTVTVTLALVAETPAVSFAIAVSVCAPLLALVVSQDVAYGAVVLSAPRFAPSSWNCTLATPTLSDAFAVTLTVPETVAPVAGAVIDTVGVGAGGGGGGLVVLLPLTKPAHPAKLKLEIAISSSLQTCDVRLPVNFVDSPALAMAFVPLSLTPHTAGTPLRKG